jgi:type IV pilus assembly protein PilY1
MHSRTKIFLKTVLASVCLASLGQSIAAAIFAPSSQPIGYVGQPTPSGNNVASGTAKMYTIDYNATNWSGNLHSLPLSVGGAVSATDDWVGGAAAKIDAQSNPSNTRYIFTMKSGVGVPFQWAQLSTGPGGQQAALDPASFATTATSSPIVNYIRGSNVGEGTTYRTRASRLGDIIHSTPVYLDDGTNKTVFVGANDGMLHAINAVDGTERFAYIPSMLIPELSKLTGTSYSHRYYVDGRFSVKKYAAPTNKTILVGALGAGGKGLFGLDVSNAAAASESDAAAKVMWEITNASAGYSDLGDTYSAPSLITLPNGTPALVVGNGYNNTGSNGHAWLYLINPSNGALIYAFDTGSGTPGSPNGLSSPSVWDRDGDGKVDTAYAGDIDGNLWKFSLVSPYTVTSLYTNSAGASQAITMAPSLKTFVDIANPSLRGVMVNFVTGRMLTSADASNTAGHFAYGIWDGAPAANNLLLEQTLTEVSYTGVTPTIRVRLASDNPADWTDGTGHHKGWKTPLPLGGERVVGDGAFVTSGVFQFFSTNPTISPNALPPGENWWMQINAMTGGATDTTHFDLNTDGQFNSSDQVTGKDPVGREMGGGVRSQLIALSANGFDVYQSNFDKNNAPPPPPPVVTTTNTVTTGDRGISDGHFDFDVYCYTNCADGLNASPGSVQRSTNHTDSTEGLNWSHMHEYDDIYDKTGVNLLAPSQDLHRLSRVKYRTAPTTATTVAPAVANGSVPTTGVTLVSSVINPTLITSGSSTKPNALVSYSYSYGKVTDATLFPNRVVSGSTVQTTTKAAYTTTMDSVEYVNFVAVKVNGKNRWQYQENTKVRTWDTVSTKVVTSPNFQFKILLSNQAYSPAVHLSIDGVATLAYNHQSAAGLKIETQPTYSIGTIQQLNLEMPLDAFKSKDWGNGTTRAGLHPTTYDCVVANPRDGTKGERRDGALTVQIVDVSTEDTDILLNVVGFPELGYRLSNTSMPSKLIAEYTIFWHHPNGKCMASSGWTKTPPQDSSSTAKPGTPALGSSDPYAGKFGVGDPSPVPVAGTVTTSVTNPDGSVTTTVVVTTVTPLGGSTVTTTVTITPKPSTNIVVTGITTGVDCTGYSCTEVKRDAAVLGRITWREIQK